MTKINQGAGIAILGALIIIAYFLFVQQDLVSQTAVAKYKCIKGLNWDSNLCISCMLRSHLHIANQSTIYVSDNVDKFKVLMIPEEGFLSCEQLLQFISYDQKIKNIQDLKLQKIRPIQQIIALLDIQFTSESVSKFQVGSQMQEMAFLQLKEVQGAQNTILTFASQQSEELSRYLGKILAQSSIIISAFLFIYYRCQRGDYTIGFLIVITINLLVYGQSTTNEQILMHFIYSLTLSYYFSKGLISRILTFIVLITGILAGFYLETLYTQYLLSIFFLYLWIGRNQTFYKIGALKTFCFVSLIICSFTKSHNMWVSLALRKIIEYTLLTMSPLLIQLIFCMQDGPNYNKIPEKNETGVSLPGLQQQQNSEDEQN